MSPQGGTGPTGPSESLAESPNASGGDTSNNEPIASRDDVRLALRGIGATAGERPNPSISRPGRVYLLIAALIAPAFLAVYLIVRLDLLSLPDRADILLGQIALGGAICALVLSLISTNWYTAPVSLGALSLILGFALRTPISSLIGWVYFLVHTPYRVGDRIRIGDAAGDVIDVGYFDTTLWEFGGEYLSTDHPSGLLIKFPTRTCSPRRSTIIDGRCSPISGTRCGSASPKAATWRSSPR